MDYETPKVDETYVGPGTAGIAQRIAIKYEVRGLKALIRNEVLPCSQNQY